MAVFSPGDAPDHSSRGCRSAVPLSLDRLAGLGNRNDEQRLSPWNRPHIRQSRRRVVCQTLQDAACAFREDKTSRAARRDTNPCPPGVACTRDDRSLRRLLPSACRRSLSDRSSVFPMCDLHATESWSGRRTSEPIAAYRERLAHRSSRVTLLGGLSSYPSRRPSPSHLYRPERPEAHPRSFRPRGFAAIRHDYRPHRSPRSRQHVCLPTGP